MGGRRSAESGRHGARRARAFEGFLIETRGLSALDQQVAHEARVVFGLRGAQDDVRCEADPARGRGGRAAVVALDPARSDHRVAALGNCLRQEELELAHLVSGELAARAVVALQGGWATSSKKGRCGQRGGTGRRAGRKACAPLRTAACRRHRAAPSGGSALEGGRAAACAPAPEGARGATAAPRTRAGRSGQGGRAAWRASAYALLARRKGAGVSLRRPGFWRRGARAAAAGRRPREIRRLAARWTDVDAPSSAARAAAGAGRRVATRIRCEAQERWQPAPRPASHAALSEQDLPAARAGHAGLAPRRRGADGRSRECELGASHHSHAAPGPAPRLRERRALGQAGVARLQGSRRAARRRPAHPEARAPARVRSRRWQPRILTTRGSVPQAARALGHAASSGTSDCVGSGRPTPCAARASKALVEAEGCGGVCVACAIYVQ